MTTSTQSYVNQFAVPFMGRFARMQAIVAANRARRAERARIIRELETYNDHELQDLGISRGDIIAVAEGSFRRAR